MGKEGVQKQMDGQGEGEEEREKEDPNPKTNLVNNVPPTPFSTSIIKSQSAKTNSDKNAIASVVQASANALNKLPKKKDGTVSFSSVSSQNNNYNTNTNIADDTINEQTILLNKVAS